MKDRDHNGFEFIKNEPALESKIFKVVVSSELESKTSSETKQKECVQSQTESKKKVSEEKQAEESDEEEEEDEEEEDEKEDEWE